MGYIGSQPATNFETVRKQVSTTNSGTTITLDYAVSSVQDILVTVNAVVQSYDNYTVSGTTLTLGGTLNNDRVEILYVGRTFQTVSPATASVTNDMLAGSIANSKLANSSITLNGSAVSLGGSATVGIDNTPAFSVQLGFNQSQSVSDNTLTKVQLDDEYFDTDSAFDATTNYRFTVPSGKAGKYFFSWGIYLYQTTVTNLQNTEAILYLNGSRYIGASFVFQNSYPRYHSHGTQAFLDLSVGDYVELYGVVNTVDGAGSPEFYGGDRATFLTGFRVTT